MNLTAPQQPPQSIRIGPYELLDDLAQGGMASVHLARYHGSAGFSRMVVVKRLHPQFAKDPDFISGFLDEARLASRISHPHVVTVLDVVSHEGELMLAMDYVHGLSLSSMQKLVSPSPLPVGVAVRVGRDMLLGLHAAHEAKSTKGEPLHIVHRDVSPQNIIVCTDGLARVIDFGIASAASRLQSTEEGKVKGKLSYMAPEQLQGNSAERGVDIFAAGIVIWEMLTGRRMLVGDPRQRIHTLLEGSLQPPSAIQPSVSGALDAVVMKALARDRSERFATAGEMAEALLGAAEAADSLDVAGWLLDIAKPLLDAQEEKVRRAEARSIPPPPRSATFGAGGEGLGEEGPTTSIRSSVKNSNVRPIGGSNAVQSSRRKRRLALGLMVTVLTLGVIAVANRALFPAEGASAETSPSTALAVPEPVEATSSNGGPGSPSDPEKSEQGPVTEDPASTLSDLPEAELEEAPSEEQAPPSVAPRPQARRVASPVRSQPKKDGCSPPYTTIDGKRRYKPECL